MGESKHTPGPWEWIEESGYHNLIGENGTVVHSDGSACGEYGPDIDVAGPDARLIAAAPDLLEALEDLGNWLAYGLDKPDGAKPTADDLRRCEEVAAKARKAVDKARLPTRRQP